MEYKVVFQLSTDDESILKKGIRQIHNVLEALISVEIEWVFHGKAVRLLSTAYGCSELLQMISREGSVSLLACRHALHAEGLDRPDIPEEVSIVPSALAHIIVRQAAAWAYIKMD